VPFVITQLHPLQPCTLPLHDALPICRRRRRGSILVGPIALPRPERPEGRRARRRARGERGIGAGRPPEPETSRCARRLLPGGRRSEEHTSELQSRENLVCRLLLEKKK